MAWDPKKRKKQLDKIKRKHLVVISALKNEIVEYRKGKKVLEASIEESKTGKEGIKHYTIWANELRDVNMLINRGEELLRHLENDLKEIDTMIGSIKDYWS